MIKHNVDFCKNEPRFMPISIFSFESYSNADDNQYKTIFISHMKNKNRGLFHLKLKNLSSLPVGKGKQFLSIKIYVFIQISIGCKVNLINSPFTRLNSELLIEQSGCLIYVSLS